MSMDAVSKRRAPITQEDGATAKKYQQLHYNAAEGQRFRGFTGKC
jgi:hypothetical protein